MNIFYLLTTKKGSNFKLQIGTHSPTRSTGSVTNLAVSSCAISLAVLGNVINLVVPDSVNSLVVPGSAYSMAMGSAWQFQENWPVEAAGMWNVKSYIIYFKSYSFCYMV